MMIACSKVSMLKVRISNVIYASLIAMLAVACIKTEDNGANKTATEKGKETGSDPNNPGAGGGLTLDLSTSVGVGVQGQGQGLRLLGDEEKQIAPGPLKLIYETGEVKEAFGPGNEVLMTVQSGSGLIVAFERSVILRNPNYKEPTEVTGPVDSESGNQDNDPSFQCAIAKVKATGGELFCADLEVVKLHDESWAAQSDNAGGVFFYGYDAEGSSANKILKHLKMDGSSETVYEGEIDEFNVLGDGSVLTRTGETLKIDSKTIGQGNILGVVGSDVYFEPTAGAKMMLADSDLPIQVVSKSKSSTTTIDEGVPLRIVEIGGKGYAVYNHFADVTNKEAGAVTMLKQIYPEQAEPVILDASYSEILEAGSKVFAKGEGKVVELNLTTGQGTVVAEVEAVAMNASDKDLIISGENKMVIVNLETMKATEKSVDVTLTQVEAISK